MSFLRAQWHTSYGIPSYNGDLRVYCAQTSPFYARSPASKGIFAIETDLKGQSTRPSIPRGEFLWKNWDIPSLKLTPFLRIPTQKKHELRHFFTNPCGSIHPNTQRNSPTTFRIPGRDGAKEEGQVEPVRKDPGLSGIDM